jgi:hypothetical protein
MLNTGPAPKLAALESLSLEVMAREITSPSTASFDNLMTPDLLLTKRRAKAFQLLRLRLINSANKSHEQKNHPNQALEQYAVAEAASSNVSRYQPEPESAIFITVRRRRRSTSFRGSRI